MRVLTFDISLDIMNIKPVSWLGDGRDRLREFPDEARGVASFELWEVQQGNDD